MSSSGNGAKPQKTAEQVAAELRRRLEGVLGRERTDAIWRDPTNIQEVVQGEEEASDVAEIMLRAWRDLPEEEPPGRRRQRSGFRRGLRLALITAVAVWSLSILRRFRQEPGDEDREPL